MSDAKVCPKCQGSMTPGFILDTAGRFNVHRVTEWHSGEPIMSHFFQIVHISRSKKHRIRAYGCEQCGYLENYVVWNTPPRPTAS
jgi:predicted nucleic-acid-binding Zn-ribbon protein